MKLKDVPQDYGMGENQREVCYAVDEDGRYTLAPSLGWEPKNIANSQAWQVIAEDVRDALARIQARTASPLAFHMARNQMTIGLLADYVGLFKWQVRRHLKPKGYGRMSPKIKQKYAQIFDLSPQQLDQVPDTVELPMVQPVAAAETE